MVGGERGTVMAKRGRKFEDRYAAALALRHAEPSPELAKELQATLADASNLIVAVAAEVAASARLLELASGKK